MERKFHGSESSLYGLFAPGNESAEERKGLESEILLPVRRKKMVKPKNRPDLARPGHVKIAIDITAVDIYLFFSLQ